MTLEVPNWLQNATYDARVDRQLIKALVGSEGVGSPLAFKVEQRSPLSLSLNIHSGFAFIDGDDTASQGMYNVWNTDTVVYGPLSAPPAGNKRIITICLRVNDPHSTGPAGNNASFVQVDGPLVLTSGTAVPGTIPNTAIPLADIAITAGQSSISNANITNRRTLCGGLDHVGTMKTYTGYSYMLPNNWALCAGADISRTTYDELYELIGTSFGVGDGSSTFTLPNLGGKTIFGPGGAQSLVQGPGGGNAYASISTLNLPPHYHTNSHGHATAAADMGGNHRHDFYAMLYQFGLSTPAGGPTAGLGFGNMTLYTGYSNDHSHAVPIPGHTGDTGPGPGTTSPIDIRNPFIVAATIIRIK